MADYAPPLDKLLTLSYPWGIHEDIDYRKLGLGREHVPDLIRLATDRILLDGPIPLIKGVPDQIIIWGPIHAWHALGQLRAEEAIGPLLEEMVRTGESADDTGYENLPAVLGKIGPSAMPALTAVLADASLGELTRHTAAYGLARMAQEYPEIRDECVALVSRQFEAFAVNSADFNVCLVDVLAGMKAVEAAPIIEQAFKVGAVEVSIQRDWAWVRWELGLGERPIDW